MGGVDLADRMLAYCPSRTRTKKWTIRCILHLFDMGLTNAWLQFREHKKKQNAPSKLIPQYRTFKMEFGQRLIEKNDLSSRKSIENIDSDEEEVKIMLDGRKTDLPSLERRTQGAVHLPQISSGIQKRCRNKSCNKKTSVYCVKCQVYLCFVANRNCFMNFHS